ncbi:P-loop containing nucleoside triphosphate hydrolase protein [Trametes coccinea BRFM310]|uniref:RNA helicase n=1 Tax=Trametes coccinea (strain BRFM310) TaxID=1353009 RepID=A0A1Y2IFV9_TRAC3|nr:P-loop containing nucleoside triphosphate hydrolase protein [Trametes coccinea BRFM310]
MTLFSLFVQAATHTRAHGRAPAARLRPPCLSHPSIRPRRFHKGPRDTVTSHPHPDEFSFERLGLRPSVLTALRLAFPSVKHPTPIQHRFIDAVLDGKDVLLKDKTGTGKSFAAVLALLSQKRGKPYTSSLPGLTAPVLPITSLVLVPHRDLAFQYLHWIERIHHHMTPQDPLPSLAQVFVRDSSQSLEEQLEPIQRTPPHILIGTPQALLDVVQKDPHALPFDRLSTIVVDEVDYLIETVPVLADKYLMAKMERRIHRHPGPTRLLLNHIYETTNVRRKDTYQMKRERNPTGEAHRRDPSDEAPQLVMMSATLRNHLRRFLLADSGWFTKAKGKLVRITGEVSPHDPKRKQFEEDAAADAVGGTDIQHHIIVVSHDGNISNVEDTVPVAASSSTDSAQPEAQTSFDDRRPELPPLAESSQALDVDVDLDTPSPFNPTALEAVAAAFALDVPSVGLLVLPSDASVQRAVHELRLLGVNAHALDVVKDENGRVHLMRQDLDAPAEHPTLLVATLASVRGLDLPELTHVFVLGVLDNAAVDSYLHVAGRVGRFGRSGKVISVVAERHKVQLDNGKATMRDEPRMMTVLLKKAGLRATKFEHFE